MTILDHVAIRVSGIARSTEFYSKALAPIGITLIRDYSDAVGFGKKAKPEFWIGLAETRPITPVHICFIAKDRAEVDAFYAAAIAAGGRDNGPPGLRTIYHPSYYGAFVLDPDGHNVEAVVHTP
jgi:catechol 2,3-dioxygenase-like lactoylglutathione lyase family enzyme